MPNTELVHVYDGGMGMFHDTLMETHDERERRLLVYNEPDEVERRERYYRPFKFSDLFGGFGRKG